MQITGYTNQGKAYYTDPRSGVTNYLGSQYDRPAAGATPAQLPTPTSGGLLTSPGASSGQAPVAAAPVAAKAPVIPTSNAALVGGRVPVTQDQWGAMQSTGTGNTFAGNLFRTVQQNNGLDPKIYDAIHNDIGTFEVGGGYGTDQASVKAYADKINPYYQVTAAPAAERTGDNVARGTIYDQFQKQAKDNGYTWQAETGNYNAYDAAGLLSSQGITSLDQLGFGAGGELINKATGQPLSTREKDQLGMSAKGTGRVDYDIRKDANGNPLIVPKWKSSTTDLGVAGKLLPIAASFIPGFGPIAASALSAGMNIAQGGEAWDAIKAAGLTYAGHELGSWAGDKLSQYAADNGLSLPSFGGSGSTGTGTDYSLGSGKLGDAFTTGNNGLGTGLLGNSTGTAGGTGAGLSVNPGVWNFGNFTSGIGANTYNPTDYSLTNGTSPINNNGSGLSTGTGGANGNGLSVSPGTGTNLFQPVGSGGTLGTGGTGSDFTVGGAAQTAANALGNLSTSQLGQIAAGVAGAVGGATGSTSGSGGYKDDGYRPTIDRTGWSPTATPTLGQDSGIGLISIPKKGQKNDGLWRYSGLLG